MTVTEIDIHADQLLTDHPSRKTYVRSLWEDQWEEVPYLWPLRLNFVAGPDISSAQLEWRFGDGWQHDGDSFEIYSPQDLLGKYIKIEFATGSSLAETVTWVGIIEDDLRVPDGARSDRPTGKVRVDREPFPTGMQMLTAYGLESLLTRMRIFTSRIYADASNEGYEKRLQRGLPFNAGLATALPGADGLVPNRSPTQSGTVNGQPLYRFVASDDIEDAENWTAADVVRYLLEAHSPVDADGNSPIPFEPDEDSLFKTLEFEERVWQAHGRTVKDLLDELINRRRGLGYTWRYEARPGSTDRMLLDVFTYADELVDLELGVGFIPANKNLRKLDFDSSRDVQVQVTCHAQHRYDQVITKGARRTALVTLSWDLVTLEPRWTSDQLDSYNAGASGESSYPTGAGQGYIRDVLNALARSRGEVNSVFARFGLPNGWDTGVSAWDGTFDGRPACPKLDAEGNPDPSESVVFHFPSLRWYPYLPLRVDYDYSADPASPTNNGAADRPREYRRAFAVIRRQTESGEIWYRADRHADRMEAPGGEEDRLHGYLVLLSSGLELEFRIGGTSGQHTIGGSEFVPLASPSTADVEAPLDYKTDLQICAAVEFDEQVEQRHPADPSAATGEILRVLYLEVPDARLDYVQKGALLDVDAGGQLVTAAKDGFVRDDRTRMLAIAELAYQWYGRERQTLSMSWQQLNHDFKVGHLITETGKSTTLETIRTVISRVDYDLEAGTMQVATQYAELDPGAFFSPAL